MKASFPKPHFLLLAAIVISCLCLAEAFAQEEPTFEMSQQKIEVGSFYHGTNLVVSGTAPANSKLALLLTGEKKEIKLNRKGRVGPLWMNVGTVTLREAPEMYYLFTSTPTTGELAQPEELEKCNIGYDVLRKSVTIKQDSTDDDLIFREFIKLKENIRLYKSSPGSITVEPNDEKTEKFSATIPIPPLVPPGEYTVRLYCFGEQSLLANATATLTVEKTGLPQRLFLLAFHHAAVYGILAIVVAIIAGLSMGILFGSKQKGGH